MTVTTEDFDKSGGPIQVFYTPAGGRRRPTVSRAEGIYIWDTAGKRYLDASSGAVVANLGHGNGRVIEEMQQQAAKVCFVARAQFENQPNKELSNLVTSLVGPGLERAFAVSGGSEATEAAIKLARQYAVTKGETARWKVLCRNPGYHGASLGAVSVTGDPETESMYGPMIRVMPRVPAPFTYRLPDGYDADSYARHCAQRLEEVIVEEGPESVLAFIMEPVGGLATGALVAPPHYYTAVREICDRHGVLLIYDEVMSGAGRTGTFLAADHWPGARPDLVTLAKGIGAGYTPLGMLLAPAGMVEAVAQSGGFLHGHTYSANPLSCAIGVAVVREMLDRELMANAHAMGNLLRSKLADIQKGSSILGDIRGIGLLNAIEIVADRESKAIFDSSVRTIPRILELAGARGLLLYARRTAAGRYGEWLMVTPPLTVTESDIAEIVKLLDETLKAFERELGR